MDAAQVFDWTSNNKQTHCPHYCIKIAIAQYHVLITFQDCCSLHMIILLTVYEEHCNIIHGNLSGKD